MFHLLSMRRLGIVVVVTVICLCGTPVLAQITHVQDAQGNGSPATATFGAGVGSQGFVIGFCEGGASGLTYTFGDNGSPHPTWNAAQAVWPDATNGISLQMQYAVNITGAPTAITCTPSSSTANFIAGEFSGMFAGALLDQAASGATFGFSTTTTTQTITTTNANDLLIACFALSGGAPTSPSVMAGVGAATWTLFANATARTVCAYAIVAATGTFSAQFSWTGSHPGDTMIASFSARNFGINSGGQFISAPMLPQVVPSPAYPGAGYPITTLASGGNLQNAINAMTCGQKLNLAHDGTFSGGIINLPNNSCACHTDPTKWQIVQGDQFEANYTSGVRTDPSAQYHQYPHVSSNDVAYGFFALASANCWGFAGLDMTETANGANAVFSWGTGGAATFPFPQDLGLWGNYIHGQPSSGLIRCIMYNGTGGAIVDNYISDCHAVGADAQCLAGWDGLGALLFQNNFCEGTGENFIIGGSDPHPGLVPADYTINRNHFFKPLAWRREDPTYEGIHWTIKNILESKVSQRVLVTGNVLENCWADGQNGIAISLKSSNTGDRAPAFSAPQSVTQDWTLFNNVIRHAGAAIVLADDALSGGGPNNQPVHRITFTNDLFWDIDSSKWTKQAGNNQTTVLTTLTPRGAVSAPYDLWLNHVTFATANQSLGFDLAGADIYGGILFTNSIIDDSANGGIVKNGSDGNAITFSRLPGSNLTSDCIVGPGAGGSYTNAVFSGVQRPANQAATFVAPGSDFHVGAGSLCHNAASDGLDMGANIDVVNAAVSGVVQALANPVTVTNVSPSTFTHLGSTSITITGTNFLAESGLGVIVGGAGPAAVINTDTCSVNTCTVVMTGTISLQVGDTVNIQGVTPTAFTNMLGGFIVASVTDNQHFTYTNTGIGTVNATGGTANRVSPGNACTSVSVVSPTSITCITPAATGTVTTGPVSVFVSQWGIPVQSTVFGNYN